MSTGQYCFFTYKDLWFYHIFCHVTASSPFSQFAISGKWVKWQLADMHLCKITHVLLALTFINIQHVQHSSWCLPLPKCLTYQCLGFKFMDVNIHIIGHDAWVPAPNFSSLHNDPQFLLLLHFPQCSSRKGKWPIEPASIAASEAVDNMDCKQSNIKAHKSSSHSHQSSEACS